MTEKLITWDEIKLEKESRRSSLGSLHQQMLTDELFWLASAMLNDGQMMQWLSGFPDGFIADIPSYVADAVGQLTNQIMVGETPDVHWRSGNRFRGEGATKKQKDERKTVERQLKDWVRYIQTCRSEDPIRMSVEHNGALGMTVVQYPLIKANIPTHPFEDEDGNTRKPRNAEERKQMEQYHRKRQGAMIYDIRPVHPTCCFFDLYNDPIQDMITEEYVASRPFYKKYPHLDKLGGNGPKGSSDATSKLTSYCSEEAYGWWLDDRPLLTSKDGANEDGVAPNYTGIMWYKMARSGMGIRTSSSSVSGATGGRYWEFAIKGLIRDLRADAIDYFTDRNVMRIMRLLYLFEPEEFETDGTPQGLQDALNYNRGPASRWIHGQGVRKIAEQVKQVPNWFFQSAGAAKASMEGHTAMTTLSGTDAGDNASVLRTNVSLAKSNSRSVKKATEQMWSEIMLDMIFMQKHEVGKPMSIPTVDGYEDIDVKKIPDGRPELDFSPLTDEEKGFEQDRLLKLKGQHAASTERIIDADPDVEDKAEELIRIDADLIMESGELIKVAAADAVKLYQEMVAADQGESSGAPEIAPGMMGSQEAAFEPTQNGQAQGENRQVTTVGSSLDAARQQMPAIGGRVG